MAIIPLMLLLAAMLALIAWHKGWHVITILLSSFTLGLVSYFAFSVFTARFIIGQGRFFSVPFGGFDISVTWIFISAFMWVAGWASLLFIPYVRSLRKGREKEQTKIAEKQTRIMPSELP